MNALYPALFNKRRGKYQMMMMPQGLTKTKASQRKKILTDSICTGTITLQILLVLMTSYDLVDVITSDGGGYSQHKLEVNHLCRLNLIVV